MEVCFKLGVSKPILKLKKSFLDIITIKKMYLTCENISFNRCFLQARTHENARGTSRPRIDACRNDSYTLRDFDHFTDSFGEMATVIPSCIPRKSWRSVPLIKTKYILFVGNRSKIPTEFFQVCTLVGMWIIPMGMSARNAWWRFVVIWALFTLVTAAIMNKATQKPIGGSTPRYFKHFMFSNSAFYYQPAIINKESW